MTETLQSRLAQDSGSGIYWIDGRTSKKAIERLARTAGWQFLRLDVSQAEDKHGFLSAAAKALHFPEWAGHNWDAFEELVNDLSWLPPAAGYLLLLDGAGKFGQRQPRDMQVGRDILETAAANRNKAGESPLVLLLRGAGAAARDLPRLKLDQPGRAQGATPEKQDA